MIKPLFIKPNLSTNRRFKQYVVIFEHHAYWYNEKAKEYNFLIGADGKKLPYLKRQHQEAFFALIRSYSVQIGKLPKRPLNKAYKYEDIPPLQMNNVKLSKALKCSKTTVWRYLNTLEQAGIIEAKIFHGTTANYEIVFNPNFILLYDEQNTGIVPESMYLSPLSENDKVSICKPYWELLSSINKKITDVDKSEKTESEVISGVLRTEFKNPYKIPPEMDESWIKHPTNISDIEEEQQSQTENKTPHDPKNPLNVKYPDNSARNKEHRLFQAHLLFLFAVNYLWPGGRLWKDEKGNMRFISEAEQRRTEEYIAENFWTHCKTPADMNKWREYFEKGIKRSADWLNNKRFDNYFVNPYTYFHKDYEKGFFQAYKWAQKQYEKDKAKDLRAGYKKKLSMAIDEYMANPKPSQVIKIISQMRKSGLPTSYLERFTQAVENNIRNNNNKNTLQDRIPNNFKAMIYDRQNAS